MDYIKNLKKSAIKDSKTDSNDSDKPLLDKPQESQEEEAKEYRFNKQKAVQSYEGGNEVQIRTETLKELLI